MSYRHLQIRTLRKQNRSDYVITDSKPHFFSWERGGQCKLVDRSSRLIPSTRKSLQQYNACTWKKFFQVIISCRSNY